MKNILIATLLSATVAQLFTAVNAVTMGMQSTAAPEWLLSFQCIDEKNGVHQSCGATMVSHNIAMLAARKSFSP